MALLLDKFEMNKYDLYGKVCDQRFSPLFRFVKCTYLIHLAGHRIELRTLYYCTLQFSHDCMTFGPTMVGNIISLYVHCINLHIGLCLG